jgi:hypothetical protein
MAQAPQLHFHNRKATTVALSAVEAAAVMACFGVGGKSTAPQQLSAARLLAHLRDRQAWIACGCRPDAAQPPLMFPRLRQGQIHLVRHGVTPHAPTCPFYVAPSEGDPPATAPWKSEWLRLKPQVERKVSSRKTPPAATPEKVEPATPAPTAITRVLDELLEQTGFNVVDAEDVRTLKGKPAVSARRDAYAGLDQLRDIPVGGDLHWRDVACTYFPSLKSHLKHLEEIADRFPTGVRPQGVFFGIVHEIIRENRFEHTLVWRAGKDTERVATVTTHGEIAYGPQSDSRTGPFWVFAQIAQRPGESRFEVFGAAVKPCLSRSVLLPVDSPRERAVAEMLLAQITYWARQGALGIKAQLEKPLHDEIAPDGTACRPDFTVWLPDGQRILIDAQVEDKSLEYLKDKLKVQAAMRKLPKVVTVLNITSDADWQYLARRLTAVAARACGVERTHPGPA